MKLLIGVATILGTVIGAGILGLPYAISVSGFVPGLLLMIATCFSMTLLLLYLGEVVLKCKEVYQLPGLVSKYLGRKTSIITVVLFTLSIYAALISYVTGVGDSLEFINPGLRWLFMFLFVGLLSYPVIKGTTMLGRAQTILMSVKTLAVIIISVALIPSINWVNLSFINNNKLFFPFGVIFFAFTGYSVIPELEQVLLKHEKQFKPSVIIAMIIALIIYSLFALSLIGVNGVSVEQVGTLSLTGWLWIIGLLLALLSMTTPFIGLGVALNNMFKQDLKISKFWAYLLTCLVPLTIVLLFKPSFIEPLIISGTYSGALTGFIIVNLWFKARNKGRTGFKAPLGVAGAVIVLITLSAGVLMTTLELI